MSRFSRIKWAKEETYPGAVVLDAGCNVGDVGAYLIEGGCIVYGVDINPCFVEIAKSKGIFAMVCPVEKITYPDDFFDICFISEVLEHLYKPEEGVAQLYRVLKPGGKLIGTVPMPEHKFSNHSKYQWVWHQHNFTKASLQGLLEKYFKPKNISIKKHEAQKDESRLFFKGKKDVQ